MELVEAIKARKSVRAYLRRPVPKEVLEQVLALASRSPSWANTQPWEVCVIGGEVMTRLKDALFQAATEQRPADPDIPYPTFAEPYISRSRDVGRRLYDALGITRENRVAREAWGRLGNKFFDAPNGVIFYLDKSLGQWSILDLGMFAQSVMLSALAFGLATCPLAAVVRYPQILRSTLDIPENKKIVFGVAIGYPDRGHPVNVVETHREPPSVFTQWRGF